MYKNNSNQNNNNTLIVLFYFHHSSLQRESIFFKYRFAHRAISDPTTSSEDPSSFVHHWLFLGVYRKPTTLTIAHTYVRPRPATPAYDTYAAYARAPQKPSSLRTRPRRGCLSRSWRANPLFILYEKQTNPRSYFIAPLASNTSLTPDEASNARMHRQPAERD